MESLGSAQGSIAIDVGQALGNVGQLGGALRTLDGQGAGFGTGLRSALGNVNSDLNRTLTGATELGVGLIGLGAGITAGIGAGLSMLTGFDQGMANIRAVTGATTEEFGLLQDAALRLGKETTFSSSEITLAMEELAKAGISVEDILNGAADGAAALAAAGGVSLPLAAAVMSTAINQFGLSGADAVHVADLLAAAASKSAVGVDTLGESLTYVGGSAASLGIPIEDITTALAIMGDQGMTGSMAGTALNQVLLSLANPTKKAAGVIQDLGLQLTDMNGNLLPLPDILGQVATATEGMGNAQRAATLETIFGVQGGRAINAMLTTQTAEADAAGESWEGYYAAVNDPGAAARMAEARLDSISGKFEGLKGSIETLILTALIPLTPIIKSVLEGLASLVDMITELPAPVLGAATAGVALVGILASLAGATILLAPRLAAARASFAAILVALRGLTGGSLALRLALLPLSGAFLPLLVVGGAVAFLFRGQIADAFDRVKEAASGVVGFLRDVRAAYDDLTGAKPPPNPLQELMDDQAPNAMIESLRTTREEAMEEARRFGRDVLGKSGDELEAYVQRQGAAYDEANVQDEAYWRNQGQILGKSGEELDRWVEKQLEANRKIGPFEATFRSIGEAIRGINGGKIPGWLSGLADLADGIGGLAPEYQRLLKTGLNPVRAGLQALGIQFPKLAGVTSRVDKLVAATGKTWGDLTDRFRNFRNAGAGPVQAALGALGQTFPGIEWLTASMSRGVANLTGAWRGLGDRVDLARDTFRAFRDGGANPVVAALGAVMAAVPALQGVLGPVITNVQQFTDTFKAFRDGGANPVIAVLGGLMGAFPGLRGVLGPAMTAVQSFTDTFKAFRDGGANPVIAALGGLMAAFPSLRGALGPIAGGVQRLTDAFGESGWGGVLSEIPSLIRDVVTGIGSLAVSLGGWVLEVAAPAVGGWLLDAAGNLVGWIGDRLPAAGTKLGELASWILNVAAPTVGGWLATAFMGMKQWLEDQLGIGGTSSEKMDGVGGKELTWSGWVLNVAAPAVGGWLAGGAKAFFEWIRAKLPAVGSKLGEIASWILDVGIPTVGGWLATAFNTARELVQGFIPNAGSTLASITSWTLSVGAPTVGGWLTGGVSGVMDWIRGQLGIGGDTGQGQPDAASIGAGGARYVDFGQWWLEVGAPVMRQATDFVSTIKDKIVAWVINAVPTMEEIANFGYQIGETIGNVIRNTDWPGVKSAIKDGLIKAAGAVVWAAASFGFLVAGIIAGISGDMDQAEWEALTASIQAGLDRAIQGVITGDFSAWDVIKAYLKRQFQLAIADALDSIAEELRSYDWVPGVGALASNLEGEADQIRDSAGTLGDVFEAGFSDEVENAEPPTIVTPDGSQLPVAAEEDATSYVGAYVETIEGTASPVGPSVDGDHNYQDGIEDGRRYVVGYQDGLDGGPAGLEVRRGVGPEAYPDGGGPTGPTQLGTREGIPGQPTRDWTVEPGGDPNATAAQHRDTVDPNYGYFVPGGPDPAGLCSQAGGTFDGSLCRIPITPTIAQDFASLDRGALDIKERLELKGKPKIALDKVDTGSVDDAVRTVSGKVSGLGKTIGSTPLGALRRPETRDALTAVDDVPGSVRRAAGAIASTALGSLRRPETREALSAIGEVPTGVSRAAGIVSDTALGALRAPQTTAARKAIDDVPDAVSGAARKVASTSLGAIKAPDNSAAIKAVNDLKSAYDGLKQSSDAAAALKGLSGGSAPLNTGASTVKAPDMGPAIAAATAGRAAIDAISAAIGTVATTAQTSVITAFQGTLAGGIPPVQQLSQQTKALFDQAQSAATSASGQLQSNVSRQFAQVQQQANTSSGQLQTGVIQKFGQTQQQGVTAATTLQTGVAGKFQTMSSGAISTTTGMNTGVTGQFTSLNTKGTASANSLNTGVSGSFKTMSGSATGTASGMAGTVGSHMSGMDAKGRSSASSLNSGVVGSMGSMRTGAVGAVDAMAGAIAGRMGGLAGSASGWGNAVGSALGAGINGGIAGWVNTIASTAASAVNAAISAAKSAAAIASPSKRADREVGQPIGQGIAQGVERTAREIADTAAAVVDGAIRAAREAASAVTTVAQSVRPPRVPTGDDVIGIDPLTTNGIRPPRVPNPANIVPADQQTYGKRPPRVPSTSTPGATPIPPISVSPPGSTPIPTTPNTPSTGGGSMAGGVVINGGMTVEVIVQGSGYPGQDGTAAGNQFAINFRDQLRVMV